MDMNIVWPRNSFDNRAVRWKGNAFGSKLRLRCQAFDNVLAIPIQKLDANDSGPLQLAALCVHANNDRVTFFYIGAQAIDRVLTVTFIESDEGYDISHLDHGPWASAMLT